MQGFISWQMWLPVAVAYGDGAERWRGARGAERWREAPLEKISDSSSLKAHFYYNFCAPRHPLLPIRNPYFALRAKRFAPSAPRHQTHSTLCLAQNVMYIHTTSRPLLEQLGH